MDTDLHPLILRCREGDPLAWEAVVRRTQSQVFGLAIHYLGDREEARDLAQEIYIRVYNKLGTFRDEERFLPWLLRIARNAAIDQLRRRKARPPAQDIPADEMRSLEAGDEAPDRGIERDFQKKLVHRALAAMTHIHREIILLKDIQGLTFEEISQALDLPVGTVKSRSTRARTELARRVMDLTSEGGVL